MASLESNYLLDPSLSRYLAPMLHLCYRQSRKLDRLSWWVWNNVWQGTIYSLWVYLFIDMSLWVWLSCQICRQPSSHWTRLNSRACEWHLRFPTVHTFRFPVALLPISRINNFGFTLRDCLVCNRVESIYVQIWTRTRLFREEQTRGIRKRRQSEGV